MTGTVLHEISERKNKNGYECLDCESEHIVRFGKYTTTVDGEKVKWQRYRCKACKKTSTCIAIIAYLNKKYSGNYILRL